ncbi:MAG TPA: TolC family protein, partial [Gemmatimonadota bacterium]|nr:TolC family protein [Gemmatimonadota bacterium]
MQRAREAARYARVCAVGLFLALAVPAAVVGQEVDTVMSLADSWSLLGSHSPEYQAALYQADYAGQNVWSAWGSWIPSVSWRMNFNRNEFTTRTYLDPTGVPLRLDDPITDVAKSASNALVFNWSLLQNGTRFFDVGAANASARAADLRAVATLVRLESDVAVRYWEALKQQELARLARQLLAARQRDVETAEARFRIAAVAQTDVLQARVQVGQSEVAVLQAEQQAEAAKRELSAQIGLPEEISYELRDTVTIIDPSGLPVDSLVAVGRVSNPDLARLEAEISAAGKRLWSSRGTWLPRIDLSLSLSRSEQLPRDASLIELGPENSSTNFGISLNWPLLNGFEKKWRTGQASAQLQEARSNKVAQLLQTDKDIRNQYDALVTAYQTVEIRTRLVDLARESVRLTTERYRIGAASYIELQQATSQATDAERGL